MKYSFTKNTIEFLGKTLVQIQAEEDCRLFDGTMIHKGDLGGWLEFDILNEEDGSWVMDNAKVYGLPRIKGDVIIRGNAQVGDNAYICGKTIIEDNAKVRLNAYVKNSQVKGNAVLQKDRRTEGATVYFGDKKATFSEIFDITGMTLSEFSKTYNIPRRTLEDWSAERRKAPEYVLQLLTRAVEQDIQPVTSYLADKDGEPIKK